ncbi:3',5'-cyclic-nucleotide phosphodiesterase [Acetobacter nitrogenifigens DSM 23921 = NBRC 105050]|uniref:3',5'-cyclic-nucleotide phosphodiesterase n=1 Tax=Acetobacter nitrogenifigens DSM 23921 = NBRC 105050 TaxID=1120919 RepID=A0A511X8G4_9PROT|nr:3',5'-cyclic-nucleotide phosphodiesterase [Acetobacter nitrogenifigens DSM 23921 = NBRC 105050]
MTNAKISVRLKHLSRAARVLFLSCLLPLVCAPDALSSAADSPSGLKIVALGVRGGIVDGDLTAFLIHPSGDLRSLMCDAGTLGNGLLVAAKRGNLGGRTPDQTLGSDIKAFLITHAHLDHVAGMLVAATDYPGNAVYALPSTNEVLGEDYLNWAAWPNFSDRGKAPRLGSLHLRDMTPGVATPVAGTAMTATAWPLEHGGVESTAFLVQAGNSAVACLGDHGPDGASGEGRGHQLWRALAPLVRSGQLRTIITEASYADPRTESQLFGHMTPKYLIASLRDLAEEVGRPNALLGVTVIVSHVKYPVGGEAAYRKLILRQLREGNDLGVKFVVPEQGDKWDVP